MGRFIISTRKNGDYQFNLQARNGQIILASEGYTTKSACENGIQSVIKNGIIEERFDKRISSNGKYYFNLKAGNGQVIGSSEMYESSLARDNGIQAVIKNLLNSNIIDVSNEHPSNYLPSVKDIGSINLEFQQDLKINRIQINKIGPFNELNIFFETPPNNNSASVYIFTGQNGTGKTTLLQLLSCCVPHYDKMLLKKFWSKNVNTSNFLINFSDAIKTKYDSQYFEHLLEKGSIAVKDNKLISTLHPQIKNYLETSDYGLHNVAFFAYSGYRKLSDSNVDSLGSINSSPFENALDFDKSTNAKTFVNWLANLMTKIALATVKRSDTDRDRANEYRLVLSYIEKSISDITDQKIEFELLEDPIKIIIILDGIQLEFDQLPDGLKSIISWVGDLIMRLDRIKWIKNKPIIEQHFILFLDEIEVHLHPAWQRKILPVLQNLFINAQIFVSTHSPFVVGSVDGAWVYRFVKKDNESILDGMPVLSEDSYSYDYILSEIFGVKERFGLEVEKKLDEFLEIKNKILNNLDYDHDRLKILLEDLQNQSIEVQNIIGMEMRQLNRLTDQRFVDL
ncbi:DUF1508 domain-containing protein [Arsenicibacter rosenii]|nr:DUF1508 domain-containing protein [Arsenicibacter rosenii]